MAASSTDLTRFQLAAMTADDYEAVTTLWACCEGLGGLETPAELRRFLKRNPGLSPVARLDQRVVGAALCGEDGRRGYLYHVGVSRDCRRRRVAADLVAWCLARLGERGISRCSVHVYLANPSAVEVWRAIGWRERGDLCVLACDFPRDPA